MSDETAVSVNQGYYTIEAPGTLRANSSYNVAVTILEAQDPCVINVRISGPAYNAEKSLEVAPFTTEFIVFDVPALEFADYILQVGGTGGINFQEQIMLNFSDNKPLIYVQLDKQGYKREDNVDFRVIFLDNNTKPASIKENIKIVIKQNEEEYVAEYDNVQLNMGTFIGQWLIPTNATAGIYIIDVLIADSSITSKSFEVLDYEKPLFNIVLTTARRVLYESRYINVSLKASFPDGTPVKGPCTVAIKCIDGYFGTYARPIEKYVDLDGAADNIIFDIEQELCIDQDFLTEDYFKTATMALEILVEDAASTRKETLLELLTIVKNDSIIDEGVRDCMSCGGWAPYRPHRNIDVAKAMVIEMLTKNPKLDESITFDILLNKPTKYFVYLITARGNILKSEMVHLETGTRKHTLSLDASFELVPRAFILAYYVFEGHLYFDEMGFDLKKQFDNKLEITAPAEADIGSEVELQFKSEMNSVIGIMAVDKSSQLLWSKNELSSKEIFKNLYHIRSQTPLLNGYGEYPGLISGLLTFTNAVWQGFDKGEDADGFNQRLCDREHLEFSKHNHRTIDVHRLKKNYLRKLQERQQTYGNWLFCNRETDEVGNLIINTELPANGNNWLLSAFSISNDRGFTMSECPVVINSSNILKETTTVEESTTVGKPICKILKFEGALYEEQEYSKTFELELPENAEMLSVELTISTNLLGPTLGELAKYAGIMYCTGMLHMTTVIPNIVVLEYLESQNQLESELAQSIIAKFPEALKREMEERNADGSFSWFVRDPASPHVTAEIMNAFQRITKYFAIDASIIKEGLDYLAAQLNEEGEIKKEVEPYQYPFQTDLGVGLTATVLLAFLKNKENLVSYESTIAQATNYIVANLAVTKCNYDLALAFYALTLLGHTAAEELKQFFLSNACNDAELGHQWWAFNDANKDPCYRPPASNLEVTSYVLLGLLETEPIASLVPIIKWMLPYGDALGYHNFSSESMDCAISLEAVLKFVLKSQTAEGVTRIRYRAIAEECDNEGVETQTELEGIISVEPRNALIIKTQVLPTSTKRIEFSTTDKGSFKGDLTYRYRV